MVIPARFEAAYIARTVAYTIESIPDDILQEVILLDDESEEPLQPVIDMALQPDGCLGHLSRAQRSKIKVVRLPIRQGLTRGKIIGADMSEGSHILFLDGHCRIKPGAVEKMLETINDNYKKIVVPLIQNVKGEDWSFIPNTSGEKMMFHWNFEFDWVFSDSTQVPILCGGILLISKRWWREGGGYDPELRDWGAENLQQSITTWLCGGEIVVQREATIGHIFSRPYPKNKVTGRVIERNHARTAIALLDARLDYFEEAHYYGKQEIANLGPKLADRLSLRHSLKCQSFAVFEKKFQPYFDAWGMDLRKRFHFRHTQSGLCLTVEPGKISNRRELILDICYPDEPRQKFIIRESQFYCPEFKLCLDQGNIFSSRGRPILFSCEKGNGNQNWIYEGSRLIWKQRNLCLSGPGDNNKALFEFCENGKKFEFQKIFIKD